ncbi:MAG TPA: GAP family protein [Solirubrobacteraceae bacterium]|jgi:cytochrome c biogenesis protein CcdA|nr:GAP family protein [Solirubrobacteraceae bacterium]
MLRLIGIVISIGLADSINPSTVAPALYMAAQPGSRKPLAQFTAGVFLVYFVGGLVIALGPGELVLSLVPRPDLLVRHLLEVLAGVVLLAVAALLWVHRNRLGRKQLPSFSSQGRAGWLLGATIMAVELPTAFPYFAALAAVVAWPGNIAGKVFLILLFNICFVLPQLAMLAMLWVAGERAEIVLVRVSAFLQRRWPVLLALVAVVAGFITIGLGATGTYREANTLLHKVVKTLK